MRNLGFYGLVQYLFNRLRKELILCINHYLPKSLFKMDAAEERNYREELYNAIQESINDREGREGLEGSVLLGYCIIAEWQAPDGHKWLTKLSGDAFCELPPWRERMFGHELVAWENYAPAKEGNPFDYEEDEDEE